MTDFEILKQDIEKYVRSGMTEANRQRLVAQAAQIGINAGQLVMLIKNAELELKFATGASNTDFPEEAGSGFMTASDAQEQQGSGFVDGLGDSSSGFVSGPDPEPRPTDHPLASQFSEIRKMEASGAMSDVYTAIHEGRRKVIIKRIKSQHRANPQYVDLFYKEFENGFGLDCPNIVRFFGKGEDAEGPFYYMEFVDGRTLTDYIHKEKHTNPEEIRKILLQLLEALKYLHARQIYHRDLKPDNILITHKGDNVKLIDFGLAAADSLVDNLAKAGTPRYAAPELMARAQLADHRSDIYSVGMIIIEMFAKVPNRHHLMDIPHELYRAMADKATMAVPKDRYQSCDEMMALLQHKSNPVPKWLEDKIKEYASDGFISRNERLVLDKEIVRAGVDRELVEAMITDELEKAIEQKRRQEVMRRNNAAMVKANEDTKPKKGGFSKFLKVLMGIVLAIVVLFALFMVFDNYNTRHSNAEGHGKVVSASHFVKGGTAVTTTRVNFRELASTGSRTIKTLDRNTRVEVISELYEWVEVSVDGKRGFIFKEYLIPVNN